MHYYGSESYRRHQSAPKRNREVQTLTNRSVDVIVTKISEIKPRIHKAVFKCESCGHDIEIDQENERELKEPLNCPQALGGWEAAKTRPDLI